MEYQESDICSIRRGCAEGIEDAEYQESHPLLIVHKTHKERCSYRSGFCHKLPAAMDSEHATVSPPLRLHGFR